MKPQFSTNILSSFFFWAQHEITHFGQAYRNYSSPLYYQPDPKIPGYISYASPFKQWVYDFGVSGATICETASGSNGVIYNRASGIKVDYENGRILVPNSFGTGLSLNATYSFPDFNFYRQNETQDALLTRYTSYLNPRFNNTPDKPVPPYSRMTPAAFISVLNSDNQPFALAGTDITTVNTSIIFMAETDFAIESALSIMRDARYKSIPFIDVYRDPLDEYNDVKTGLYPAGYDYQIIKGNADPSSLLTISYVQCSRVSDRVNVDGQIFIGLADVEIQKVRNPRIR